MVAKASHHSDVADILLMAIYLPYSVLTRREIVSNALALTLKPGVHMVLWLSSQSPDGFSYSLDGAIAQWRAKA